MENQELRKVEKTEQQDHNNINKSSNRSKLLKGVLIGSAIGGAATAIFDSTTRRKVKSAAVGLKNNSVDMFKHAKKNPREFKELVADSVDDASEAMKGAVSDVQDLNENIQRNASNMSR
ncbi:YtxH domain-containing protein [Peribacillus sp. SCS-155]|uniref:YtxH domain-containing protein n=1 Tax=Peribacillus sedimenti TaxID=3115297 RepID=UPI0039062F30